MVTLVVKEGERVGERDIETLVVNEGECVAEGDGEMLVL